MIGLEIEVGNPFKIPLSIAIVIAYIAMKTTADGGLVVRGRISLVYI
jgi:hypothetical protein